MLYIIFFIGSHISKNMAPRFFRNMGSLFFLHMGHMLAHIRRVEIRSLGPMEGQDQADD
jgi:hypothetical protein